MDEELGAERDLLEDLTHFLTKGAASDQMNVPSSTVRLHTPTKSLQHCFVLAGGAQPKDLVAAFSH